MVKIRFNIILSLWKREKKFGPGYDNYCYADAKGAIWRGILEMFNISRIFFVLDKKIYIYERVEYVLFKYNSLVLMCVMVEYVGDSTFGGGSGITYTLLDYDSRIVTHGS